MKGANSVVQQTNFIVEVLGRDIRGWANSDLRKRLSELADSINPGAPNIETLLSIEALCHIKILGDVSTLNLGLTLQEWDKEVEKLEQKCARLRRRIEKNT